MKHLVMIYSNEHGAWWRPNYCGYTQYKDKAGIFELEDALKRYPHMTYNNNSDDYFVEVSFAYIADQIEELESRIDKLKSLLEIKRGL